MKILLISLLLLVGCQSNKVEIEKECDGYKLNLTFEKEGDWWENTRCSQQCLGDKCGVEWKDYCYGYQMNLWRKVPKDCYYQEYPVFEQSNGIISHPDYGNYPTEIPFEQGMTLMPGQSASFNIVIELNEEETNGKD